MNLRRKIQINMDKLLAGNCVIPAVHTMDEFRYTVENTDLSCLMVKFGDLENLPELIRYAHQHGKSVMLHWIPYEALPEIIME